jgi:hypothetical protein
MTRSNPWRNLAAAIIHRAVLDAQSSNGRAAAAQRWLLSDPWAGDLLEALEVDRRQVASWVDSLEPLAQLALGFLEHLDN